MRFQVPQFIGVEDKVFGSLTIKQFIYLAGGAGLAFLLFHFLPVLIGVPLAILALALGWALGFYPVNNRPFVFILESAFRYLLGSKLYLWRKEQKTPLHKTASEDDIMTFAPSLVPKLSQSKLKDLTWTLGIKENENPITSKKNA